MERMAILRARVAALGEADLVQPDLEAEVLAALVTALDSEAAVEAAVRDAGAPSRQERLAREPLGRFTREELLRVIDLAARRGAPTAREKTSLYLRADLLAALRDRAARDHRTVTDLLAEGAEAVLRAPRAASERDLARDWVAHARLSAELARALTELDPPFSVGEASLIADALNGTITDPAIDGSWTPSSVTTCLYAEIADYMRLSGGARWLRPGPAEIEGSIRRAEQRAAGEEPGWDVLLEEERAMLARLRGLTPIQAMAIVDAIARFWRAHRVDTGALLEAVGLVRP